MTNPPGNKFFNLSDITPRIQEILQPHIGKQFWVKAEISSGRERGGSFYCDLVESDETGKIKAQMRCTIWNRDLTMHGTDTGYTKTTIDQNVEMVKRQLKREKAVITLDEESQTANIVNVKDIC
jgi:uncharacterized protein YheU (UPF0270 family)